MPLFGDSAAGLICTSQELGKLRVARALPVIGLSHGSLLRSRGRLLHGAAVKRTELDHGLQKDLDDNEKPVHVSGAVFVETLGNRDVR